MNCIQVISATKHNPKNMEATLNISNEHRDLLFNFNSGFTQINYNKYMNMEIPVIYDNVKDSKFQYIIKMKFIYQSKCNSNISFYLVILSMLSYLHSKLSYLYVV